jgi:putative thioredoxin
MQSPFSAAPSQGEAAFSIDVTEADFRETVLQRSMEVPVLVDCWAPWCAPCRNLKPILEKLAAEYEGRFVLAKLNTDEAPQISAALQIRSIPLVVLFVGGRPVDQFSGALPESQVRAFLDRHLGPQISEVDAIRQEAAQADADTAEALLMEALGLEPDNLDVVADLAERLMARDALDAAQELLASLPESAQTDRLSALRKRLELASQRPEGNALEFSARIESNPKDFEARFGLAALQMHAGDYDAAFDQLLAIVLRDKADWREKARTQLVEWFEVCPDAEAVSRGRRYLGMYLN